MMSMRNKQRPFRILKYLHENTDENHPVSTPELVRIFKAEDAHANGKTVKDTMSIAQIEQTCLQWRDVQGEKAGVSELDHVDVINLKVDDMFFRDTVIREDGTTIGFFSGILVSVQNSFFAEKERV